MGSIVSKLFLDFWIFLYLQGPLSYSESDILSVTHVLGYNIVRF